mmetsp:Transcript_22476/g.33298  ORF Transcript_22476/g.33298 Transcript_22476/m.33298 type:complete len:120 (-) Transcript_22476:68-427(-)
MYHSLLGQGLLNVHTLRQLKRGIHRGGRTKYMITTELSPSWEVAEMQEMDCIYNEILSRAEALQTQKWECCIIPSKSHEKARKRRRTVACMRTINVYSRYNCGLEPDIGQDLGNFYSSL